MSAHGVSYQRCWSIAADRCQTVRPHCWTALEGPTQTRMATGGSGLGSWHWARNQNTPKWINSRNNESHFCMPCSVSSSSKTLSRAFKTLGIGFIALIVFGSILKAVTPETPVPEDIDKTERRASSSWIIDSQALLVESKPWKKLLNLIFLLGKYPCHHSLIVAVERNKNKTAKKYQRRNN